MFCGTGAIMEILGMWLLIAGSMAVAWWTIKHTNNKQAQGILEFYKSTLEGSAKEMSVNAVRFSICTFLSPV